MFVNMKRAPSNWTPAGTIVRTITSRIAAKLKAAGEGIRADDAQLQPVRSGNAGECVAEPRDPNGLARDSRITERAPCGARQAGTANDTKVPRAPEVVPAAHHCGTEAGSCCRASPSARSAA